MRERGVLALLLVISICNEVTSDDAASDLKEFIQEQLRTGQTDSLSSNEAETVTDLTPEKHLKRSHSEDSGDDDDEEDEKLLKTTQKPSSENATSHSEDRDASDDLGFGLRKQLQHSSKLEGRMGTRPLESSEYVVLDDLGFKGALSCSHLGELHYFVSVKTSCMVCVCLYPGQSQVLSPICAPCAGCFRKELHPADNQMFPVDHGQPYPYTPSDNLSPPLPYTPSDQFQPPKTVEVYKPSIPEVYQPMDIELLPGQYSPTGHFPPTGKFPPTGQLQPIGQYQPEQYGTVEQYLPPGSGQYHTPEQIRPPGFIQSEQVWPSEHFHLPEQTWSTVPPSVLYQPGQVESEIRPAKPKVTEVEVITTTIPIIKEQEPTCYPLPENVPFQHPLNPCQICLCKRSVTVYGQYEISIGCQENQQCILPAHEVYLPDNQIVPLAECQEFPPNVVFPHPKEPCKQCLCVDKTQRVICEDVPGCKLDKPFGPIDMLPPSPPFTSPGGLVQDQELPLLPSIPKEPVPGGVDEITYPLVPTHKPKEPAWPEEVMLRDLSEGMQAEVMRPGKHMIGPLPGPRPHKTCKPFENNKPFQHPWDPCRVCICSEANYPPYSDVEVNCYTKASCCTMETGEMIVQYPGKKIITDPMCELVVQGDTFEHPQNPCKVCVCKQYGTIIAPSCNISYHNPECADGVAPGSGKEVKLVFQDEKCRFHQPFEPFELDCERCYCHTVYNLVLLSCQRIPGCRLTIPTLDYNDVRTTTPISPTDLLPFGPEFVHAETPSPEYNLDGSLPLSPGGSLTLGHDFGLGGGKILGQTSVSSLAGLGFSQPYLPQSSLPNSGLFMTQPGYTEINQGGGHAFVPLNVPGNAPDVSQGFVQGSFTGPSQGFMQGSTPGLGQGFIQGSAPGLSQGYLQGSAPGLTQGFIKGSAAGLPQGFVQGSTPGLSQSYLQGSMPYGQAYGSHQFYSPPSQSLWPPSQGLSGQSMQYPSGYGTQYSKPGVGYMQKWSIKYPAISYKYPKQYWRTSGYDPAQLPDEPLSEQFQQDYVPLSEVQLGSPDLQTLHMPLMHSMNGPGQSKKRIRIKSGRPSDNEESNEEK